MEALVEAIYTTPIIDHHAHNLLLQSHLAEHPFLSITTEAAGSALNYASSTLAHMRAVKQLAEMLDCKPTWEDVQSRVEAERKAPNDAWARRCFSGIETVLVDDGLDQDTVHPFEWHDRLTRSKCKRIVRIERIAEIILVACFRDHRESIDDSTFSGSSFLAEVTDLFVTTIEKFISDPNVVGFKSVICYRTGLAVPGICSTGVEDAIHSILRLEDPIPRLSRLEDEHLSPYFLHVAARLIESSSMPLQFHTGLGDNDIRLTLSSPSHLQPFIDSYPSLPIVLLHASYPFTKEAGYLASTYENVYLDIGEVFPMVSQQGQENVIREALELCPSEKLTWSTDGHWFPETYLLAVVQVREAMEHVLGEYVDRNILAITTAIKIVCDIFFDTSNKIYKLRLSKLPLDTPRMQKAGIQRSLASQRNNFAALEQFLATQPSTEYVCLQWLDYTATLRLRILPVKQALKRFREERYLGVTKAVLGLLQQDTMCPGFSAVGEYSLYPCVESLRVGAYSSKYATVQCEFREQTGDQVASCPRTLLRRMVEMSHTHGMDFLVGFEIEVVFMKIIVVDGQIRYGNEAVSQGHAWSTARALQNDNIMSLLEMIVENLRNASIEVEQFHPESGPGQYEFALSPLPPLLAVDALLSAREIIASAASKHSMRATSVPKAYAKAAGSGAHIHLSMTPSHLHEMFYSGVLRHLRAITAFTYPTDSSYERVGDSVWAGGSWVAWGVQNREVPLRKIEDSHWEIKCVDGLANPYLALGAIIGAGIQGVQNGEPLTIQNCPSDPALLGESKRKALGICQRLPGSIDEATGYLSDDTQLRLVLGDPVVETYLTVKQAESDMLQGMEVEERRNWLIERY